MKLSDIANYISAHTDVGEGISVSAIDGNAERYIGVYPPKSAPPARICIGGLEATRTDTIQSRILIHWTADMLKAEAKAKEVFGLFFTKTNILIGVDEAYLIDVSTPISVGKDSNGMCEYIIELKIIYKKGVI